MQMAPSDIKILRKPKKKRKRQKKFMQHPTSVVLFARFFFSIFMARRKSIHCSNNNNCFKLVSKAISAHLSLFMAIKRTCVNVAEQPRLNAPSEQTKLHRASFSSMHESVYWSYAFTLFMV